LDKRDRQRKHEEVRATITDDGESTRTEIRAVGAKIEALVPNVMGQNQPGAIVEPVGAVTVTETKPFVHGIVVRSCVNADVLAQARASTAPGQPIHQQSDPCTLRWNDGTTEKKLTRGQEEILHIGIMERKNRDPHWQLRVGCMQKKAGVLLSVTQDPAAPTVFKDWHVRRVMVRFLAANWKPHDLWFEIRVRHDGGQWTLGVVDGPRAPYWQPGGRNYATIGTTAILPIRLSIPDIEAHPSPAPEGERPET
jgi:hypothetical protein